MPFSKERERERERVKVSEKALLRGVKYLVVLGFTKPGRGRRKMGFYK